MKRLVLMLAAAVLAAGAARAAEPVPIRAGWIVPVSDVASILFAKPGIAKNDGKTYKYVATHYQGTTLEINALANGDLDMALLAWTSLPLAIQNAKLDDLRVIAEDAVDGEPGYFSIEYFVRADSGIAKVSDLKGKVVATNALGSAVGIAMQIGLAKNGIDTKRDVSIVEAPFPAMKAMLLSGKADLIPSVLPFAVDPELVSKGRVLFTTRDAIGPSALTIWVARKEFLEKNRAAVMDFLADYLRAMKFYTDPKNHDEAVQIASKFTKIPPKVFQPYLFTKKDLYRPPGSVPNLQVLQSNVDTLYKFGYLKSRIDMSRYVDTSLIEEAAKRVD